MEAIPIKATYKSGGNYNNTYLKLDTRYTKTLKKLQARFDNNLRKKVKKYFDSQWQIITKIMSPEELAMTKDEWIAYAKKRYEMEQDSLNKINTSVYDITRNFEIEGLGIWNCDQQLRLEHPITIAAMFKDVNDKIINPVTVYVIDKKINGVLTYPYTGIMSPIILDPSSETAMYIVETNGAVALVDKQTIKSTLSGNNAQNHYTFRAYEVNPATISTAYLRKSLGME
jgi:hypothetical protein